MQWTQVKTQAKMKPAKEQKKKKNNKKKKGQW